MTGVQKCHANVLAGYVFGSTWNKHCCSPWVLWCSSTAVAEALSGSDLAGTWQVLAASCPCHTAQREDTASSACDSSQLAICLPVHGFGLTQRAPGSEEPSLWRGAMSARHCPRVVQRFLRYAFCSVISLQILCLVDITALPKMLLAYIILKKCW